MGKTGFSRLALCRGYGFRVGRGMTDPIESVVGVAALIEALFEGDPPLLERAALGDVQAAPDQRFWLLRDIKALLE